MRQERGASGDRGRVVMLVDGAIDEDPRTGWQARCAAEAGWQVVVLGLADDGVPSVSWDGEVQERLLPMDSPLHTPPHQFRRSLWRRPLAYPPGHTCRYRVQQVEARRADLQARRARLDVATAEGDTRVAYRFARAWWPIADTAARAVRAWVGLRARHSEQVPNLDTRADRLYTRLTRLVCGVGAWRRLDQSLWDYELCFGSVLDALSPDVIHASDSRMLGVGARAKARANVVGGEVKLVWDARRFLPASPPADGDPRWLPALCAYESEYVPDADCVIAGSEELAEQLRKHHRLPVLPTVVLYAPDTAAEVDSTYGDDIRARCGLDDSSRLLVYSGETDADQGLDLAVQGLTLLPEAHLALVVDSPDSPEVIDLRAQARRLRVSERLHVLQAPRGHLTSLLAGADAAVLPIRHQPQYETAFSTNFFAYSHARLPLVVSDVKSMARTARRTGQGEVFWADNVNDYVRAVGLVLADPRPYREAYLRHGILEEWTSPAQAQVLETAYVRMLSRNRGRCAIGTAFDHSPEPVVSEVGQRYLPAQTQPSRESV